MKPRPMPIQDTVQHQRKNVPQMSNGSRRLLGLGNSKPTLDSQSFYKSSHLTESNISAISNKITTSDDDDEEYVLMYDSK